MSIRIVYISDIYFGLSQEEDQGKVLKEYMIKGFALNDLLKNAGMEITEAEQKRLRMGK